MTTNECKKDAARRLKEAGVAYEKLTARTISFEGFGYGRSIFVSIHGAKVPMCWKRLFADVPKPSAGGYVPELDSNTCVLELGKTAAQPLFS